MTIYVLETNTTGSGLDILDINSNDTILVTDNMSKYKNDLSYEYLVESRTCTHKEFDLWLKKGQWPNGNPSAIISNSDSFLLKAIDASEQCGLNSPDSSIYDIFMNKAKFRAESIVKGVNSPKWKEFHSLSTIEFDLGEFSYPVIVKPTYGTGSIGVKLCYTCEEAKLAAEDALKYDRTDSVLVEQYISGPLYSAEVLVNRAGELKLLGITNRQLGPGPFFVEESYTFPVDIPEDIKEGILEQIRKFDIKCSMMLHVEFILDAMEHKPILVEINPRVGGGMLSRMISESIGRNVFEYYVSAWTQNEIDSAEFCKNTDKRTTHFWIYPRRNGCIRLDENTIRIQSGKNFLHSHFMVNNGDYVESAKDFKGAIYSGLIQSGSVQVNTDLKNFYQSFLEGSIAYES